MVLLPALIATRALLNRFRDVPAAAAKHAKTGSKTVPNYRQFASLQRYEHAQRYKERGSFSTASTT